MSNNNHMPNNNHMSNNNHVHLSCPELQSSPMGLPLDIDLEDAMTAPVGICNTCTTLATNPSQGHGPRLHTRTPPAYLRHMHCSPELIFNQSTPPSSGADRDLTALDRQQYPYDNLFAWEDWCHPELCAGDNTPLQVPNELGSLGTRENSIVIEDLPDAIPLPYRVFTHTVPSADTPATPTPPIASLDISPTLPVYYLQPSHNDFSTGQGYSASSDPLNPPVTLQDTLNLSFITPNSPILRPPTRASPGFWSIDLGCDSRRHATVDNSSTSITSSSATMLPPLSSSPYYYTPPSATSPYPDTSPSTSGIDPPDTSTSYSLGSADIQRLFAQSESALLELGYHTSTGTLHVDVTMYSNEEEGEDVSDSEDMNQQPEPLESPEIILTWHEVRMDTGSEQEEEVETQE